MMSALVLKNASGINDVTFMRLWSVQLAQFLTTHGTGVQRVELFGSLARGKGTMGSDFDVIVCVDGFTSVQWLLDVRNAAGVGDMYGPSKASIRQRCALSAIGISPVQIEGATGISPWKQDYFLFPSDWRNRLETLQHLGDHTDPEFMQNIARDALTFVPNQGFAFPLFPRDK
jgi:hypothetical protein